MNGWMIQLSQVFAANAESYEAYVAKLLASDAVSS